MSEYIHKAHNVSVLIYHIVCPAKYRRVVIGDEVDKTLKEICEEIEKKYEIKFLEIGTEGDHAHFLVQSVPTYSPTKIVRTIKSITVKETFKKHLEVKEKLWGGEFWSDGHYVSTVGKYENEETITNYVKA
jgi:REP element-mobilizing transposase RayT